MKRKLILVGMFLLVGILLISFSSAYIRSVASQTIPGYSYSAGGGLIFDQEMCEAGQDFILQIAPSGCTPSVVRSDLLEEQNVALYCPIQATQLNPLITIEALNSITLTGQYPREVSGVGFHPSKAALQSSGTLDSAILSNLGYAVIVLRQQPNESALTNCEKSDFGGEVCWVEGNLTARLRYDIEDAFGVGRSNFYLPEMTDSTWDERYVQYSFWDGKGYLRADGVDESGTTISVYSNLDTGAGGEGKLKLTTFNLEKGETSNEIYLPGVDYCIANFKVRLDGLENPDTRARLRVNADVIEVAEGEKFLDNNCYIRDITDKGLNKEVEISCKEDDQRGSFSLMIEPRIVLDIGGIKGEYKLGEQLYQADDGKFVYLGYVGAEGDSSKVESLYAYLVALPVSKDKLSDDELESIANHDSRMRSENKGSFLGELGNLFEKVSAGVIKLGRWAISGVDIKAVSYVDGRKDVKGSSVQIVGFADAQDVDLLGEVKYLDSALEDYDNLINSYPDDKSADYEQGFGELALYEKIILMRDTGQKKTMFELCGDFKEQYPNSKKVLPDDCTNGLKLSNSEISVKEVLIDGQIKKIYFDGIYEPSREDFSAEVKIQGPNGKVNSVTLMKDEIFYLDEYRDSSEQIVYMTHSIVGGPNLIYFIYDNNKWHWSFDRFNWMDLSETTTRPVSSSDAANLVNDILLQGLVQVSTGASLNEKELEIVGKLKERDLESGKQLLVSYGGSEFGTTEFVQLISLDEDTATLRINLKPEGIGGLLSKTFSIQETLEEDLPEAFGSGYLFTLTNVNLKRTAKVSVIPNIDYAQSEAKFNFKVGVEKRGIQLAPEVAEDKIKDLEESIKKWEQLSDKLGVTVKDLKTACIGTAGVLTVKNFLENSKGKGIARQEVMKWWKEECKNLVNDEQYVSYEKCLLENSDDIDSDVDKMYNVIETQNTRIKELQDASLGADTKFLGQEIIDTDKFVEKYSAQVQTVVKNNLGDTFEDPSGKGDTINLVEMQTILSNDGWQQGNYNIEQLRDIELYTTLLKNDPTDEMAKKSLYSTLLDVQNNAGAYYGRATWASDLGINSNDVGFLETDENVRKLVYHGLTNGNIGGRISGLDSTTPVEVIQTSQGQKFFVVLDDSVGTNKYSIKTGETKEGDQYLEIYDEFGNLVSNYPSELSNVYFEKYDEKTYKNQCKKDACKIRYYETEPYAGLPAVVPFDLKNGWYAAIKTTLALGNNVASYDESGRVNSFYLCNVGEDGAEDFFSGIGDDICQMVNLGTGQPYNQFPGLESGQASTLVSRAINAINVASDARARKEGIQFVTIEGERIPVGNPAISTPEIQCEDFMSPKDCNLIFNLCDPVICPSSRCDFGGTYPVQDVVQSGIIGSLTLCLPNLKEGIYMPVCLTGVLAGIDSFISVQQSYRDCLQTSLDTGETVGICDELHSVYMCEFFWRQSVPLAKIAIPKLMSVLLGQTSRGGGEYLGVANAWEGAQSSFDYFTQYYAENSFQAFKFRNAEQAGGEVCKNFVSLSYPDGGNLLDALTEPDSPSQYTGWFEEVPFTTATNPPVSQYKVFYHIYAGKDRGAYYSVYLRGSSGSSYYRDTASDKVIASGYIAKGDYATDTDDSTGPSGYQELCIRVNGETECGFSQVSTSLALDYIQQSYVAEQASETLVTTESECVSGSADLSSVYSLLNVNLQSAVSNLINPELYNQGIIRICATANPGIGTDADAELEGSRWVQVGYCGDEDLKCWLDQQSVKDIIEFANLENDTLEKTTSNYLDILISDGNYLTDAAFASKVKEIKEESDENTRLSLIEEVFDRVFLSTQKAYLLFLRGGTYSNLAVKEYEKLKAESIIKDTETLKQEEEEKQGVITGIQNSIIDSAYANLDKYCGDNCWTSAIKIYDDANKVPSCVYSQKNSIAKCELCGCERGLSGCVNCPRSQYDLREGDLLQVYNGNTQSSTRSHNVIFEKWFDKENKIATIFQSAGGGAPWKHTEEYDLDKNYVTIIWQPKIGSTDVTTSSSFEPKYNLDSILNGETTPPRFWEPVAGEDDVLCAKYARVAAEELFGLIYYQTSVWCRSLPGFDKVIWNAKYVDESNINELDKLEKDGVLKPGMIIGIYWRQSSYNGKVGQCYLGKNSNGEAIYEEVDIDYTHNMLYLGKNDEGKLVFAEYIFSSPGIKTLDELESYGFIPMAVFGAPDTLNEELNVYECINPNLLKDKDISVFVWTLQTAFDKVNELKDKYGDVKYSDVEQVQTFIDEIATNSGKPLLTPEEYVDINGKGKPFSFETEERLSFVRTLLLEKLRSTSN